MDLVERVVAWLRALDAVPAEAMGVTEQNTAEPRHDLGELVAQMESMLVRIGQLEQEVRDLQHKLELAQGGVITTFPG